MEYLVRWKGYSPEHDSWVLFTDFIKTDIIDKYHRWQGINGSNDCSGLESESSSRSLGYKPGASKVAQLE